ncbi:hypothetical protein PVAP13_1KG183505 [Panicum virgatum]|uniref:Uncharacterized protein n=1 Tax=Panicum virgatum TaxID=38727 RepID=A0A8T0XR97_PANVG|nr:hypothetical protein PVAP13_1KG183505 [Panicum virgatum]
MLRLRHKKLIKEPSNTVAISWIKKQNQLTSWKLRAIVANASG